MTKKNKFLIICFFFIFFILKNTKAEEINCYGDNVYGFSDEYYSYLLNAGYCSRPVTPVYPLSEENRDYEFSGFSTYEWTEYSNPTNNVTVENNLLVCGDEERPCYCDSEVKEDYANFTTYCCPWIDDCPRPSTRNGASVKYIDRPFYTIYTKAGDMEIKGNLVASSDSTFFLGEYTTIRNNTAGYIKLVKDWFDVTIGYGISILKNIFLKNNYSSIKLADTEISKAKGNSIIVTDLNPITTEIINENTPHEEEVILEPTWTEIKAANLFVDEIKDITSVVSDNNSCYFADKGKRRIIKVIGSLSSIEEDDIVKMGEEDWEWIPEGIEVDNEGYVYVSSSYDIYPSKDKYFFRMTSPTANTTYTKSDEKIIVSWTRYPEAEYYKMFCSINDEYSQTEIIKKDKETFEFDIEYLTPGYYVCALGAYDIDNQLLSFANNSVAFSVIYDGDDFFRITSPSYGAVFNEYETVPIYWDNYNGADSYKILYTYEKDNQTYSGTYSTADTNYALLPTTPQSNSLDYGKYEITVKAYGEGNEIKESINTIKFAILEEKENQSNVFFLRDITSLEDYKKAENEENNEDSLNNLMFRITNPVSNLNITWDTYPDAGTYSIYVMSEDDSLAWQGSTTLTSIDVNYLPAGTYTIIVYAYTDAIELGGYELGTSDTTNISILSNCDNLSSTFMFNITNPENDYIFYKNDNIAINWGDCLCADDYKLSLFFNDTFVEIYDAGTDTNMEFGALIGDNALTYGDYSVIIYAYRNGNEIGTSDTINFTIQEEEELKSLGHNVYKMMISSDQDDVATYWTSLIPSQDDFYSVGDYNILKEYFSNPNGDYSTSDEYDKALYLENPKGIKTDNYPDDFSGSMKNFVTNSLMTIQRPINESTFTEGNNIYINWNDIGAESYTINFQVLQNDSTTTSSYSTTSSSENLSLPYGEYLMWIEAYDIDNNLIDKSSSVNFIVKGDILYIADSTNNRIVKLNGGVSIPADIADYLKDLKSSYGSEWQSLVSDYMKFKIDSYWNILDTGSYELDNPQDISVGNKINALDDTIYNSDIYIADTENKRIIFQRNGSWQQFGGSNFYWSPAKVYNEYDYLDNRDYLYVVDSLNGRIVKIATNNLSDNNPTLNDDYYIFGRRGQENLEFSYPADITYYMGTFIIPDSVSGAGYTMSLNSGVSPILSLYGNTKDNDSYRTIYYSDPFDINPYVNRIYSDSYASSSKLGNVVGEYNNEDEEWKKWVRGPGISNCENTCSDEYTEWENTWCNDGYKHWDIDCGGCDDPNRTCLDQWDWESNLSDCTYRIAKPNWYYVTDCCNMCNRTITEIDPDTGETIESIEKYCCGRHKEASPTCEDVTPSCHVGYAVGFESYTHSLLNLSGSTEILKSSKADGWPIEP